MSIAPARFVACLEDYMFRTPPAARGVELLSFPGVRGRRTPIPTPFTNLVGVAGPGVEVPDPSVDAVFEEFAGRGIPFGWLLGPNSPDSLAERLSARGMQRAEEFRGLVLTDLTRDVPVPEDVSVREVGADQEAQFVELLSRAVGLPAEMVAFLCEIVYFADSEAPAHNYFVYLEGVEEPVGTGTSIYDPDDKIVILAGSAVLEEHRGRGAYRALVRRRQADALSCGIEAAVIQAVRSTSAPICQSLGFEEVCTQELHAWSPDLDPT